MQHTCIKMSLIIFFKSVLDTCLPAGCIVPTMCLCQCASSVLPFCLKLPQLTEILAYRKMHCICVNEWRLDCWRNPSAWVGRLSPWWEISLVWTSQITAPPQKDNKESVNWYHLPVNAWSLHFYEIHSFIED